MYTITTSSNQNNIRYVSDDPFEVQGEVYLTKQKREEKSETRSKDHVR